MFYYLCFDVLSAYFLLVNNACEAGSRDRQCVAHSSIPKPSDVFSFSMKNTFGPGSVVGIATAYGLDGPGIESRWGEIFRTCPDRP